MVIWSLQLNKIKGRFKTLKCYKDEWLDVTPNRLLARRRPWRAACPIATPKLNANSIQRRLDMHWEHDGLWIIYVLYENPMILKVLRTTRTNITRRFEFDARSLLFHRSILWKVVWKFSKRWVLTEKRVLYKYGWELLEFSLSHSSGTSMANSQNSFEASDRLLTSYFKKYVKQLRLKMDIWNFNFNYSSFLLE